MSLALSLLPAMSLMEQKTALAATGARSSTSDDGDVFLGGNYIEVGIAKTGSFGTSAAAADGFHACGTETNIGLSVDGDGFDTGNDPTTGDFFLPGTPEERYTLAYKISGTEYENANAERNSTSWSDPVQSPVTTDESDISAGTLKATTTGVTKENIKMESTVSFDKDSKMFLTTVTITNQSSQTVSDVRFVRSFDPDQDADISGEYSTYNKVICNPNSSVAYTSDQCAMVVARGGDSLEPFFFLSYDSRARASILTSLSPNSAYDDSLWTDDSDLPTTAAEDNYALTSDMIAASNTNGYEANDVGIAITFDCGELAAGESTTLEYYSSLDPDISNAMSNTNQVAPELTDAQKPTAVTGLTATGSAQALVTAPTEALPDGYVMYYALGTDATTAPTSGWSTTIPTATEAGTYYIWYYASNGTLSTEPVCITVTIAPAVATGITDEDIAIAEAAMMKGLIIKQSGSNYSIKWYGATSADGYYVFASYCGKRYAKVADISGSTTTEFKLKKLNGKKINIKKNVKIYVAAYKTVEGSNTVLAKTLASHVVGSKNKKYTNPKALKLKKSSYTIAVGNTAKVKASVTRSDKSKKLLRTSHVKKFRYRTSDASVATVSKKGVITGVSAGTCTIYVTGANGLAKSVSVTVE